MRRLRVLVGLSALVLSACGDSSNSVTPPPPPPPPPPPGTSAMQATVDGSVWRFTTANVATAVIGGGVSLGAQRLVGSNIDALNFVLSGVTATGTYALTTTSPSRFVNLQTGGGSWVGNGAGAATGSITFTTFSSARLAGIFSFTATPLGGGATGNKVVTAGTFDVAIAN